jgi:RAQPRD family integrative conjugative element protein
MVLKKTSQQFILWLVLGLASGACTASNNLEQTELDDITRQLTIIEHRINVQASKSITERQRYYFDYKRLKHDISTIKQGINRYQNPIRAQPRDPIILTGDYQTEDKP